jgi:predicted glycoside hydrolase/deacetylase ChbG (UPF0249 family)
MSFVKRVPIMLATALMASVGADGQERDAPGPGAGPTLAERLGYDRQARLLIVHADDVGSSRSASLATFDALASGQVTSASVMVPCAGLSEVAEYAATHRQADLGLHLTLTSGPSPARWGPVASKADVPSLIDSLGYLLPGPREALRQIDPKQVEIELRAQIRRARDVGLQPTHLDSHEFVLFFRPELFEIYLRMGKEAGVPVLLAKGLFSLIRERMAGHAPDYESLLASEDVVLGDLITMTPEAASAGWPAFYEKAMKGLGPGVGEVVVHVGYEREVPPGLRGDEPFGSAWRQRELDFFTGSEFKELLRRHDVRLISWRDVARLRPAS